MEFIQCLIVFLVAIIIPSAFIGLYLRRGFGFSSLFSVGMTFIVFIGLPVQVWYLIATPAEDFNRTVVFLLFFWLLIVAYAVGYRMKIGSYSVTADQTLALIRKGLYNQPRLGETYDTNWIIFLLLWSIGLLAQFSINPDTYGAEATEGLAVVQFVSRLLRPLSVYSLLRVLRGSRTHLVLLAITLASYLPLLLISGRRSDIVFIAYILLSYLLLRFRLRLRFGLSFIVGVSLAFVASASFYLVPLMRITSAENMKVRLGADSAVEGLTILFTSFGDRLEPVYAIKAFSMYREAGVHSGFSKLIMFFWSQFVPRQLVGSEFKDSFRFDHLSFDDYCQRSISCMADSLQDLWWYSPTGVVSTYEMFGVFSIATFFIFGYLAANSHKSILSGSSTFNDISLFLLLIIYSPLLVYDGPILFISSTLYAIVVLKALSIRF